METNLETKSVKQIIDLQVAFLNSKLSSFMKLFSCLDKIHGELKTYKNSKHISENSFNELTEKMASLWEQKTDITTNISQYSLLDNKTDIITAYGNSNNISQKIDILTADLNKLMKSAEQLKSTADQNIQAQGLKKQINEDLSAINQKLKSCHDFVKNNKISAANAEVLDTITQKVNGLNLLNVKNSNLDELKELFALTKRLTLEIEVSEVYNKTLVNSLEQEVKSKNTNLNTMKSILDRLDPTTLRQTLHKLRDETLVKEDSIKPKISPANPAFFESSNESKIASLALNLDTTDTIPDDLRDKLAQSKVDLNKVNETPDADVQEEMKWLDDIATRSFGNSN